MINNRNCNHQGLGILMAIRHRNDILNELYNHSELQPIWRMVDWAYSDPSALWIRDTESKQMIIPDEELSSAEGVKQGDPLGVLLCALSMKPML